MTATNDAARSGRLAPARSGRTAPACSGRIAAAQSTRTSPARGGRIAAARVARLLPAHFSVLVLALGFAAALGTTPAAAHHSFSVFDMTTERVIKGEVVEFEWTNPHTWAWINVTDDNGTVTKWGLEGMSPNYLGRRGWTRHTLEPGDVVEVTINPLKSGEPGGTFLRATLEDGTVKVMFGGAR